MKLWLELVIEKDRAVMYKAKCRSFVNNFAKIIAACLGARVTGGYYDFSSTTVVDVNGNAVTVYGQWFEGASYGYGGGTSPFGLFAPGGDDSFGVVVGSGSTPVSTTDYRLASKILHGAGAGQLDYGTHVVTSSFGSSSSYIDVARSFTNRSGGDVTVRETGLIARNLWGGLGGQTAVDVKFLIARDVLPTPITVKALGSLTVRYRISLSL